ADGRGHRVATRQSGRGRRRDGAIGVGGRRVGRTRLRVVHPQQARRVGRLQDAGHPVRTRPLLPHPVNGFGFMEPILLYPDPPAPELVQTLDLAGYQWKAAGSADGATRLQPPEGWSAAIVAADADPEGAFALCRALRRQDAREVPVLLL